MCSRSDKLSLKQSILNNASEWETERAFRLFQWENLSHVTQDAHSRTKETVLFPLFLRQLLFSIRLLAVHVLIYSNISIPLLTCVCVCVFLVGIVSQFAKQTTTKGIQLWNAIHWLKSCVRDFSAPLSKDYLLFEEKEWRKQFSLVFFHHFTPFPEFPGRHPKFVQQTEEKFIKVGCVLNLDGCLNKMEECASE